MFFSDFGMFGMETPRSAFNGPFESLRLFSATPPAIPAMAAPPARSGVFALDASCATLPPACETAPFDDELVRREAVDRLLALGLRRLVDRPLDRDEDAELREDLPFLELELRELLEELLPFFDLPELELERLPLDLLLEDRVF
jgi:hypothetical protein